MLLAVDGKLTNSWAVLLQKNHQFCQSIKVSVHMNFPLLSSKIQKAFLFLSVAVRVDIYTRDMPMKGRGVCISELLKGFFQIHVSVIIFL